MCTVVPGSTDPRTEAEEKEMRSLMRQMMGTAMMIALVSVVVAPVANAQTIEKKTRITTNIPIEVPGKVVLVPGTYVLKTYNADTGRHTVQFFNRTETELYTTAVAVPTYQVDPPNEDTIVLFEPNPGHVRALQKWLYAGSNYGLEFVYPKGTVPVVASAPAETEIAANEPPPPPAPPEEVSPAPEPAPAPAPEPQVAAPEPAPAPAPEPEPEPAPAVQEELPKTAGQLPLLLLAGVLSLVSGLSLKRIL
jgi:hypothetical protein